MRGKVMAGLAEIVLVLTALACSESKGDDDDGGLLIDASGDREPERGRDAPLIDVSSDAAVDVVERAATDGASSACGTRSCGADEVCIFPCCGGAPPQCQPPPDGGTCPTGARSCALTSGFMGCARDPSCTPPPPSCHPTSQPLPFGCTSDKNGRVACACG